jgi:ribose-phosphate pyrophosphokinase
MPGTEDDVADDAIERIIVTDSVPPFRLQDSPPFRKIDVLASSPLHAETIRRLHENRDLTDLLVF